MHDRPALTRPQRRLVGTVVVLAVLIAAIGFAGSYAAVRKLAVGKGFGRFAIVFPLGLDVGIVVLLALDLLLAWLRIPFPLLRQTAWLLTAATIAFNAAAAWPDPIGTGMHAVLPILFIMVVEAGRHAVGRIADITADKHMDRVRLSRWLLSPLPTFRLWRRMKLWELRSYDKVIKLEQDRLVYRARLQADHGWCWRWTAPVDKRLQLRLARYGRPVGAPVPQPDAPALDVAPASEMRPDAPTAFDAAVDEAVALAPPAASALALEAAPAPASEVRPDAHPTAPPAPANTVPTGAHLLPVICRPRPALGSTGLHLDLVPMHPALHAITADAQPPVPHPHPPTRVRTPPAAQRPDDEALIARAVEIGRTRPLALRILQTELHIGQARAQRILPAAEERIRAAATAEGSRPALASTG